MPDSLLPTGNDGPEDLARAIELTQEAIEKSDAEEYDEAESLLRAAVEAAPENELIVNNYVNFCIEVAQNNLNTLQNYSTAIAYFKRALTFKDDDPEAWMDIGTAYAELDEPLETLQAWQRALTLLDPAKPTDKMNIGILLENVRVVQRAVEGRQSRKSGQ